MEAVKFADSKKFLTGSELFLLFVVMYCLDEGGLHSRIIKFFLSLKKTPLRRHIGAGYVYEGTLGFVK